MVKRLPRTDAILRTPSLSLVCRLLDMNFIFVCTLLQFDPLLKWLQVGGLCLEAVSQAETLEKLM
ncbi:MAG: hypothetical protein QXT81_05070 [Candidatus Bathyarchaeia archaeon]